LSLLRWPCHSTSWLSGVLAAASPAKTRLLLEMGKGPYEAHPFRTALHLAAA
jgi:hypothetical protein